MNKRIRFGIVITILAIVLMMVICALALQSITTEYRRSVSGHLQTTLNNVTQLVALLQQDEMSRVQAIAAHPDHTTLVEQLLQHPDDRRLTEEYARWITPIFRSRGFEGYSFIDLKHTVVAATSPAFVRGAVSTPVTKEALGIALKTGIAVTRPISSPRPVMRDGIEQPIGTLFQLACARIDIGSRPVGFLCLRSNPQLRLFKALEAGRTGNSGEAYIIDTEGRIISPIRFEGELRTPVNAAPGWSAFGLLARVPQASPTQSQVVTPADSQTRPLTQIAAGLLQSRTESTGYQEDYLDYRGRAVIGMGRWLKSSNMGLIVEEDLSESFSSYDVSRNALLILTTVAIGLILGLTTLGFRSQR